MLASGLGHSGRVCLLCLVYIGNKGNMLVYPICYPFLEIRIILDADASYLICTTKNMACLSFAVKHKNAHHLTADDPITSHETTRHVAVLDFAAVRPLNSLCAAYKTAKTHVAERSRRAGRASRLGRAIRGEERPRGAAHAFRGIRVSVRPEPDWASRPLSPKRALQ